MLEDCQSQISASLISVLNSLFITEFFQTVTQIVFAALYGKESNMKNFAVFKALPQAPVSTECSNFNKTKLTLF